MSIAKDGQEKEKISNAFNQLQLSATAYSLGVRAAISGEKKRNRSKSKTILSYACSVRSIFNCNTICKLS